MSLCREYHLRQDADQETLYMFDLWHSLCNEVLGEELEIIASDSKNHPEYQNFPGEINTCEPYFEGNKVIALCLWLNDFPRVEQILITHELGHWIMRLKGYKAIRSNTISKRKNIMLHSLCDHPVLYKIQRDIGHDPQNMIDIRSIRDLRFVNKIASPFPGDEIELSLQLSDNIFNTSKRNAKNIIKKARKFHPVIYEKINKIIKTMKRHNLFDTNENIKCRFELVKRINLMNSWHVHDDVKELRKWI